MKQLAPVNDGSYLGWMVSHTRLKTDYTAKEEKINAGISLYNEATKKTEDDPEEETALETVAKDVEDALAQNPKDYDGAVAATSGWADLLPAIHAFHQARRDFFKRPLGPDAEAERTATQRAAAITVKSGSPAATFKAKKIELDACIREHQEAQDKAAAGAMAKIPTLYGNTKYFTELKKNATSTDQKIRVDAHAQMATCAKVLENGAAAKKVTDAYKTNRSQLPNDAQIVLDAMVPNAPASITSSTAVEAERLRIAAANALQAAYDEAKPYADARKAVESLGANPPADLAARHKAALLPPKTAADFAPRTLLLQALPPLWQPASDYAKTLASVQDKSAKIAGLDKEAGSKVQQAIAEAKKLAAQDKFQDAVTLLASAQIDVDDRQKDIVLRVKQGHKEATQAIDAHDAMDDSDLKTQLGKLRKALPTKIELNTDLAEADRAIKPNLLLGALIPLATEYTKALEAAEANWASLPVTGFADARKTVTAPLKLPDDPLKITEAMFTGPTQLLTTFNAQWEIGRKNQLLIRNLEIRLERLVQARPEGGEAFKKEEAAIRKDLNAAKMLTGPNNLKQSADALALVGASITGAIGKRVKLAGEMVQKLPLEPGPKAVLDGIAAATDRNGRPLGASLYLEFGRDLPKLLAALDKLPGDADHAKAAKTLAALGQHLGAEALQQLASDICNDDAAQLGGVMVDVLQKGLGTGAPEDDNDSRLANLKTLADAFADSGKLSALLRGLARGDSKKAGERMDHLLTKFFAKDPKKLKTPFFDELEKGPKDVSYLIRQAVTFQKKDKPAADELEIDRGELRGASVDARSGKHFLNRHTRDYCAFKAENLPPAGKDATFWPEGTSNDDVQKCLKDAVAAMDKVPGADVAGATGDFVRRYIEIDFKGRSVRVQVGFEYTSPNTTKITQFFPLSGPALVKLTPKDLEAINKALPKP